MEELDQDEASKDIGIDDLEVEVDASRTHTVASTPNGIECSSLFVRKEQRMMTRL